MKYLPLLALTALLGAGCTSTLTPPPATPTANSPKTIAPVTNPAATAPSAAATTAKPTPTPKPIAPKTTTPTQPAPTQPTNTTYVVHVKDNHFVPQVLAVKTGDVVMWYNDDAANHTSIADMGPVWDSGNIPQYGSYKRVFAAPGSYPYHCGVHGFMTGTIVVK